jgi:hypothetical protein
MARDDLGRWVPGGNDISPPVSGGKPASADEPPPRLMLLASRARALVVWCNCSRGAP